MIKIILRFYEELNDFLTIEKRKLDFDYSVAERTAIKDVIESLGVPHTEVDLILINGKSVDFNYQVKAGDFISVYPVFESLDISNITHLRAKPLRTPKFILDVHLGKLARHLRLLGFDVLYENNYSDNKIIEDAVAQKRIILTRDIGILKNKKVTHGYWLRNTNPKKQVIEILNRFDLKGQCQPFTRCIECNGKLEKISKQAIETNLLADTKKYYQNFMRCQQCHKIYWQGSHYQKLIRLIQDFNDHLQF